MRHVMFLLLFALAPIAASADTTGALNGRVLDSFTQKPLANVLIQALSPTADLTTHTNARGDFVLLNLPPDTYRVVFTLPGYSPNGFTGLQISAGNEIHVQVALQRELRTSIVEGSYSIYRLVRRGVTADLYEINHWVPQFGAPISAFGLLPFVPGVTIGAGPRAMR